MAKTIEIEGQEYEIAYERPEALTATPMRYCPGCTHGIAHRLVAEAIDELGVRERTVAIASVGCSVYAYEYFNMDAVQAAHGRAPAVATGIKRVRPDSVVFTYQGDGDLGAIGLNNVLQAAQRAEKITVIFINNGVFAMTRGQMAPTTLIGQKTTTSPAGRSVEVEGHPLDVCELMAAMPGVAYLSRESAYDVRHVRRAKTAVLKAFRAQVDGLGLSLVEILSACPQFWRMKPLEALTHLRETVVQHYPLKVYRDPYAEAGESAD